MPQGQAASHFRSPRLSSPPPRPRHRWQPSSSAPHHRLLTGGWCAGTFRDEDGALCLFGAIRFEGPTGTGDWRWTPSPC
ncbi:DUF6197 family protein [Streptomyces atroolivaceus]